MDEPSSSNNSNTEQASLFQGENQIYPSRRNAANIEHQNQSELPANVRNSEENPANSPDSEETSPRVPTLDECYAALLVRPSDSVEPSDDQASASSSNEPKPVVNILPVNRNLIERPSHNLIAFGRKPKLPTLSASLMKKQKKAPITPAKSPQPHPILGWQADKKTLKERIAHMYCNETLADVFFVVGNDETRQTIPAHKFVLSIGSVVFDAMFNGGLTPRNTEEPIEIELPDVEPPAFLTLLKFLYSDEVNIGPESVMTTLYTAKKYAVPAMETACVEFLTQSLEADNAFMLLTQAKLFDEPQLEQLCLELIDRNTIEALNGDGFTEIDLNTLCDVLMRDTLRIRELHLFQVSLSVVYNISPILRL
ncbi:unnamed protein product [Caenorhabditis angaria]|uniref:BTB domain-containing protein n=1 Tax=Caenorhabditis angaria TaxID=860376 RepID=A0A9P1N3I9_9PELO|nr:unnamed protein product [Caenorhabditis angaria]